MIFKQALMPMVIAVTALTMPVLIVWLVLRIQQRRNQLLFDTVRHLADKGLPVPRELLDPPRRRGASPRFRAITVVGVGVGLVLMFWWMDMRPLIGLGLLALCIGAAQLLALAWEPKDAPATAGDGAADANPPLA